MASRVHCDHCDGWPADALAINIGSGFREVDLCASCQEVAGLPKLTALLDEYGVPVVSAAPVKVAKPKAAASDDWWPCPSCSMALTSRAGVIGHLISAHGLSRADASHGAPPRGLKPTVECPTCGFLTTEGPGLSTHTGVAHG